MTPTSDRRIPLTIVTGFLGSGKTTLIRHMLSQSRFVNAAVIVNEFGEIGIDHHLFRKTDERITLLRDGCACCARRDDLVDALLDLIRRFDRGELPLLDGVLLETTGLADPAPILHTIAADPILCRRYRVETTIATLDAIAGESNLGAHGEAVRQIAAADVVAITKGDLADPEARARLAVLAAELNPAAVIVATDYGRIEANGLFGDAPWPSIMRPSVGAPSEAPPLLHASSGRIASLSLVFDEPLDWRMLGLWLTMLLHCHGDHVLRVKGLLDVGATGPLLLEGVQHVVHAPRHLQAWPDDDRRSRLVFITRDLEPTRIGESLETFQALARHGL